MPPSHVNLHPTPSPKISNVPPGYKCYHNLNTDHAYGALSFAQASLNAHLCLKLSAKNVSAIEFIRNSVSIYVISAYI